MRKIAGLTFILSLFVLSLSLSARAEDFVLPQSIWNAQARFGLVTGLSNHYGQEGSLWTLSRLNQTFDTVKIRQFVPEFQQLVDGINRAFPNYRYGDAINLGTLEFQGNPEFQYSAFVLARGMTPTWTLAVAVPFMRLESHVRVVHSGQNNAAQIQSQVVGTSSVSPTLTSAFQRLATADLGSLFQQTLNEKGYRPFGDYVQSFTGDAQLVSLWQYYKQKRWTLYQETSLNLPTGPSPDPDNLQAPTTFGQTSANFLFHQNYQMSSPWDSEIILGYWLYIPDRVKLRVPVSRADSLPTKDRTEELQRKLGDVITIGGRTRYFFSEYWMAHVGLERCFKGVDSYSGNRGYDYSILSDNTESYWDRAYLTIQFSTIDAFFKKQFAVPLQAAFMTSDYIGGKNVDRQQINEVALKMFF